MRVEDQVVSFIMFKEANSPRDIDNCYRVDLVKENIEDNSLKEALSINHETSIIYPVSEEIEKSLGNTNVVEAPPHSSKSNVSIGVIEPLLSSFNHHKPYKKMEDKEKEAR
ncbi:hypothetical protein PanWU01x14_206820 [Parasponia andersonii]|uniref:Uncharacterized protein n=1 Tax=Parasponia andersonii TaxID=3476 RepID=A0A2P5BVM7_PARAD|nr:hypothetical protein PanWU01x14_206820 [Parasponia andersonii]